MLVTNLEGNASYLGYLAVLGVTIASYSTLSNVYHQKLNNNTALFNKLTRWGLIVTIFAGLSHGLLMTQQKKIDFYDLKTYWIYGEGLLTLNLIVFLAFSFNQLKSDLKKFIYLIYALLFFLGCHLGNIPFWKKHDVLEDVTFNLSSTEKI